MRESKLFPIPLEVTNMCTDPEMYYSYALHILTHQQPEPIAYIYFSYLCLDLFEGLTRDRGSWRHHIDVLDF